MTCDNVWGVPRWCDVGMMHSEVWKCVWIVEMQSVTQKYIGNVWMCVRNMMENITDYGVVYTITLCNGVAQKHNPKHWIWQIMCPGVLGAYQCTGPNQVIGALMNGQGKEDLTMGRGLQLQPMKVAPLAPKCSWISEHQDTKSQLTQRGRFRWKQEIRWGGG